MCLILFSCYLLFYICYIYIYLYLLYISLFIITIIIKSTFVTTSWLTKMSSHIRSVGYQAIYKETVFISKFKILCAASILLSIYYVESHKQYVYYIIYLVNKFL